MRTCLVAMPWMTPRIPQCAVGALAAFVRKEAPKIELSCLYEYARVWNKNQDVYQTIAPSQIGELIYLAHLYPERRSLVKAELLKAREKYLSDPAIVLGPAYVKLSPELIDQAYQMTEEHLEELVGRLSGQFQVVGLCTSFRQLFAALALSQRLKAKKPETQIVLGGSGIAFFPKDILALFPFVDFAIPGEGEFPFLRLLEGLEIGQKDFPADSGILTRENFLKFDFKLAPLDPGSLPDLNQLPMPDFREYLELASELNFPFTLAIEGSRGCFWNRRWKTGDPFDACYFCSFPCRSYYRQKDSVRLGQEMVQMAEQYQHTNFLFTESSFRATGVKSFAQALKSTGKDFIFECSPRPSILPIELVELWEAGCRFIYPGFEGLSSGYLKRLNKGVTVIQILQTMKTCFELELPYTFNMLIRFPGATQAEIDEIAANITDYAICYYPTVPQFAEASILQFSLEPDNTVYHRPDHFRVANLRNEDFFKNCLPEEIDKRLLLRPNYDDLNPAVDWTKIKKACEQVTALYEGLQKTTYNRQPRIKPLAYFDGGNFMEIVDQRQGHKVMVLENTWREVYLFCTRIRSRREILERFGDQVGKGKLEDEILTGFLKEKIMYHENHRFLSLAAAWSPQAAAQNVRKQFDIKE